jgi:hypothetical protein
MEKTVLADLTPYLVAICSAVALVLSALAKLIRALKQPSPRPKRNQINENK